MTGTAKAELAHLAVRGAEIAVRVTPRASRNRIEAGETGIRIHVTQVPEDGKATEAARRMLAAALGIAPSRLDLLRGATSRDKLFRVSG